MPQDANCPKCSHSFPVTEARHAFSVTCPRCEAELTAEFKKPATPPEAGQPPYDLQVKTGALPGAPPPLPQPVRRKKDDEDEDEPKSKGNSALIVFLSGGLGLLVVLGGLGLTGWFLFTQIDVETTSTTRSGSSGSTSGTKGGPKGTTGPKGGVPGVPPGGDPFNPPKPKDTFELKPVPGPPPPITPPTLPSNVSEIALPGRVGQVAVGGGGRYVVMHFPEQGQLGAFDVNTAQVSLVAADTGDVRLAAGLSRVVLHTPNGNVMRVYALPNLAKQFDASSPFDNYKSLAMGSRTNGPVLGVGTFGDLVLLDVSGSGVKVIEGSQGKPGHHWNNLRASPDGTAFTTFDGFNPNNRVKLLTEVGRKWKVTDLPQVPFPGADGNFYGNGTAVSRTGQQMLSGGVGTGSGSWYIPAVSGSGNDFVKLAVAGAKTKRTVTVTLHANRNADFPAPGTSPLTGPEFDNLMDVRGNTGHLPWDRSPDQYLFYVPEAKLLITLNPGKDRLILRKTDAN